MFNRIDIIEAHLSFCCDYHCGQGDKLYARSCNIRRYYRPSLMWNGFKSLSANGKLIYHQLEEKYGLADSMVLSNSD